MFFAINGGGSADESKISLIKESLKRDFKIPFKIETNPQTGTMFLFLDGRNKKKISRLEALLCLKAKK